MEKKFFDLCSKLVEDHGFSLYGLNYRSGQQLLCLFIENPKTKTAVLDDCVLIDRAMTPFVEEEEWMPSELTLEVSSPGVYRDIYEGKQFFSLIGERLAFHLIAKIDDTMVLQTGNDKGLKKLIGQKKIEAYLIEFDKETLELVVAPGKESLIRIAFKLDQIKKANVEPAWDDIKN